MTKLSYVLLVRDLVFAAISTALAGNQFVYNGFTVEKAYIPFQKIQDAATKAGKVFVIPATVDDSERKSRGGPNNPPLVKRDVAVQIAFQRSDIAATDQTTLDQMILLREQLLDVVKNADYSNPNYPDIQPLWERSETLRDENGVPFHYFMLREASVFETYFTSYFCTTHQ